MRLIVSWALLGMLHPVALGGMQDDSLRISILAVGDINLGRSAGQIILADSVDYPLERVRDVFKANDIVFANLESQITDQSGETQHPRDIYIFCAPPAAAKALSNAGISVVSTANNHAYDYEMKGLVETIEFLRSSGLGYTGTTRELGSFQPAIIECRGMRIGFLAYTQFVNRKLPWYGFISLYEEERARQEIGELKRRVDVVIVSYHGGAEYVDEPNKKTLGEMRALVDAGADVILGHHPHVPQGIELYKGKWIFYSLGNFVFLQPQRYWTQRSFGAKLVLQRELGGVVLERVELLPLRCGMQPSFGLSVEEERKLLNRLQRLSRVQISKSNEKVLVSPSTKHR